MTENLLRTLALLLMFLLNRIYGEIRVHRCYSCMSPVYEELFRDGYMSRYFYEPKNFTAECDDPVDPRTIGVVPCRTICLTLTQDFVVMGRKTGRKLTMRGCATSLNKLGLFNRTLAMFDRIDVCRNIKVSDLFRYETDTYAPREIVHVCSCLGDRCNAAIDGSRRPFTAFGLSVLTIAMLLFLST
uniref:Protein quiver n=1 Tax=Steinernema glaseri TaxID=37863 RepID=A0A1I7Z425_9BILA